MALDKYLDRIIQADAIELMKEMPSDSVDLIFADPPYNLQLRKELYRPNQTKVDGVFDQWDKFDSFAQYDEFTRQWLEQCKRLLKPDGTIWVIGTYHNIFRVGAIMQDLGFWLLNDIVWIKHNPMPNFRGTRFTNAHETLIWASKSQEAKYTFHYKALKAFNDDLQMRSDWYLPICSGKERLKIDGQKVHSTQKPEALLYRVILATTNAGDVVLDPFSGTGTTAAVAKRLRRHFIGIEKEEFYVKASSERINEIIPVEATLLNYEIERKPPKVPFGALLENGYIKPGEQLISKDRKYSAIVLADGSLKSPDGAVGSIHRLSAQLQGKKAFNGWKFWYVERDSELISIDTLRERYRKECIKA